MMDRIEVTICVATKSIYGDAKVEFGASRKEIEESFEGYNESYAEDWEFNDKTFTFEQTPDGLKLVQVGY